MNRCGSKRVRADRHGRKTGAAERAACELQAPGRRLDQKKPLRQQYLHEARPLRRHYLHESRPTEPVSAELDSGGPAANYSGGYFLCGGGTDSIFKGN